MILWAACCLRVFGFLRAGEFMVNSVFHPSTHMTVSDLQADSLVNPTCFKVHIKYTKTDPFRMGCDIYLGRGKGFVCPIVALGNYLSVPGSTSGPLFTCECLSFSHLVAVVVHCAVNSTWDSTWVIASVLWQPPWLLPAEFPITLSRP